MISGHLAQRPNAPPCSRPDRGRPAQLAGGPLSPAPYKREVGAGAARTTRFTVPPPSPPTNPKTRSKRGRSSDGKHHRHIAAARDTPPPRSPAPLLRPSLPVRRLHQRTSDGRLFILRDGRWFPRTERSSAVGIAMAGFQLGNTIRLLLSPIIMSRAGIFGPFVIFGLFGFLWVLVWISAISSTPGEHAQISAYELEYITKGQKLVKPQIGGEKLRKVPPFSKLLSKWPTWALISANAMHSWGYFVILSWMPVYFKTIYHVNLREAAWFSALPWVMMAVLGYVAGVVSDKLIQNGTSITLTRKIMQTIGFVGPGIALLGLNAAKNPIIASAWLTFAVGLKSFGHSGFLVNLQEIAPQYAGVLHGMSNTAGTFAAILGTVGAGFFVDRMGSFRGFLILTSLLYFSSALFWDIFATGERVDFDGTS